MAWKHTGGRPRAILLFCKGVRIVGSRPRKPINRDAAGLAGLEQLMKLSTAKDKLIAGGADVACVAKM